MNIVFEFMKYSLNAKGRHGIHSPFVYQLVNTGLQKPLSEVLKNNQKKLFKALKNDKTGIHFIEYGAGSKRLTNQRTVSEIFATNSTKKKYGNLLIKLMDTYKPMHVLELGTSIGCGSLQLHWGNPTAKIVSVEACKETYEFAMKTIEHHGNKEQFKLINSTFQDYLALNNTTIFDLIYIDGHHDGKSLINYVKQLEKNTHNETLFILDDIRWSNDMLSAWKQLINDEQYHLTIDFFKMGVLIRQDSKRKEHFVLRK